MVPRLNPIALILERFNPQPLADPAKPACKECAFAGQKQNYDDYPCQRSAPIAAKVESWQDPRMWVPRFPVMHGDDWCGEFKEK